MNELDRIAVRNKQWWQRMVSEGCGFTQPWLNLTKQEILRCCSGELKHHDQLQNMFPAQILNDVGGKDVLCLASGGGQQSVVFGLLGANVTVLDFSEKQLAGDQKAAAHYGYQVTTILADMRDLSSLADRSFDLVYQAPSTSYIPEVKAVYSEVGRVLRHGGLYRVAHTNPAVEFVDLDSWDGEGYRIRLPYSVRKVEYGKDESIQFRHYLQEIFNGLIEQEFSIQQVLEAPYHLEPKTTAEPGTWEHILIYIPWIFAILAKKD